MNSNRTLRQQAEELVLAEDAQFPAPSFEEMRRMLHESRVRQIELEMQNEELRLSQSALDDSRTHYIDLYKRAEMALRESEMRWRFALEVHGDAMWDWDADEDALFLSPVARELFKLADTPGKRPICDLLAQVIEEDRAMVRGQIDALVAGQTSQCWHECRLVGSGPIRWLATHGRVMKRRADGRPQSIVGFSCDVSERKLRASEAQRQRALVAHQGRLVMLGELASALAHEINQPLTAITGFAAACARRTATNPEALELVRAIEEQALRAGEIAWRMRGFARRQSMGRSELNMAEVAVAVAKWMSLDSANLDVVIDVSGVGANLPKVRADRVELEQVLINLVQNGIDAGLLGAHGQRIVIAGCTAGQPDQLEISVTDWGCGMPVGADLDAFQPFATSKKQGLGLGLTICSSIIEGYGGRLWATANPEGGTVFHFTLPAVQQSE